MIVACGLTFVIVLGEIDISVGSLMGLLATVHGPAHVAEPRRTGPSPPASLRHAAARARRSVCVNGLLVTLGRMPSIIVTLGMLTVCRASTNCC